MLTEFTIDQAAIERGTKAFTASFTDENGNPVLPKEGFEVEPDR